MSDIDEEMLNDFIEESEELLDSIEEDFLSLESSGNDPELINKLFRAVHTIKGTAGFIGLANIGELSHSMETLLGFFREGKENPSKKYIDALLLGSDKLKQMIDNVHSSDGMDIKTENELLTSLNKQIESGEKPPVHEPVLSPPAEESKPEIHSDKKFKNNLDTTLVNLFTKQATEVLNSIDHFLEDLHNSKIKLSKSELEKKCHKVKVLQGSSSYLGLVSISEMAEYFELQLSVLGSNNSNSVENEFNVLYEVKDKMQLLIDDVYSSNKENVKDFIEKSFSNKNLKGNNNSESLAPVQVVPGGNVQKKSNSTPKKESLRVSVTLIDQLMRLAGELVLIRNQQSLQFREEAIGSRESIQRLDSVTSELQESIMHTRLQPISNVFNKFPRVVRDLGNSLNKDVDLIIEGGEVELDKTIVEQLAGPMTHLVRNSIDHGIETPDIRKSNGKSPTGTLTLSAVHEGGIIIITITDDGNGIDTEVLKNKVLSKGLLSPPVLEKMSNEELLNLIFLPGFSTNEAVSSVSGRGVGMDVVKTAVEALSGAIKIDSVMGQGTSIILKLPLTLSIIPSLLIRSYNQVFAIPQVNLDILVSLAPEEIGEKIEKAGSEEIYRIQDSLLPLVRLNEILVRKDRFGLEDKYEIIKKYHKDNKEFSNTKIPMVIAVLGASNRRFGLIVDEVIGAEEIVVNPMHPAIKNINIYSGAAIMGDGSVALILNAEGLAFHSNVEFNVDEESDLFDQEDKEPRESIFLFTNKNEAERYGVSLSIIKRIVEVEPEDIQSLSEKDYINIDDTPYRVVRLNEVLDVSPNIDTKRQFLIIFKQIKKPIGLLVSELRDIADVSIDIENSGYIQNGILGSDVINNKITMFIDINAIFSMAEPKWFEDSNSVISSFDKTKKRIFVVDDSSIFRQMITKYLKEEGYILSVGKNGREAYNALELEDYDMLVSDIEMPEMNGYDLIKAVRKGSRNQNITALALSSLKVEEARAPAIALGFNDYQVKLEKKDFIQKVESMLILQEQGK